MGGANNKAPAALAFEAAKCVCAAKAGGGSGPRTKERRTWPEFSVYARRPVGLFRGIQIRAQAETCRPGVSALRRDGLVLLCPDVRRRRHEPAAGGCRAFSRKK